MSRTIKHRLARFILAAVLATLHAQLAPASQPATAPATPRWTGDPRLGADELEAQWQTLAKPDGTLGIRGIARFAYEASALNWHPERVERALARVRELQDLDKNSKTYGNFAWYTSQPKPVDLNAVEFVSQILGLLHRTQLDKLTPKAREILETTMTTAIDGLRNHTVKVEYTNIWIKKSWCLISIGEALNLTAVANEGYQRLEQWLACTAQNGITEYNAVTYYGTDLDSLCMISKFAKRAKGRANATKAMQYFWANAAAIWWPAGDRLGSANSRSYDYLSTHGYFEAFTWTAGWLRQKPELENAGWIGTNHPNLVAFYEAAYVPLPSEWTQPILAQVPRTVVQRWGEEPHKIATTWIGNHAGLGTSGATYGRDERTLVANLGASPDIPQIILFMDGRGDPFGTKKVKGKDDHAKALHLTPFLATVQRGPEALQLLSYDPARADAKAGALECLLTHITIPREAEVWVNDRKIAPGARGKPAEIPAGETITLRIGDAALAIRILNTETKSGQTAPLRYIDDGRSAKARRITITHSDVTPQKRATTLVWMRAAENLDENAFATFRKNFASAKVTIDISQLEQTGEIDATVHGLSGPMRIQANVGKQKRNALEGGDPRPEILSVNGREIGLPILKAYRVN